MRSQSRQRFSLYRTLVNYPFRIHHRVPIQKARYDLNPGFSQSTQETISISEMSIQERLCLLMFDNHPTQPRQEPAVVLCRNIYPAPSCAL